MWPAGGAMYPVYAQGHLITLEYPVHLFDFINNTFNKDKYNGHVGPNPCLFILKCLQKVLMCDAFSVFLI